MTDSLRIRRCQREDVIEAIALIAVILVLAFCALTRIEYAAIISFAAVFACCSIMLFNWERSAPSLKLLLPTTVLAGLASAGRLAFAVLPNIQPVTAICVFGGYALGRRSGFLIGALTAFVSNCFLGQGIWTPWQMYAWGSIGYIAGVLFHDRKASIWLVAVYGFFASFAYSFILDTWAVFGFTSIDSALGIATIYATGFAMNVAHAITTALLIFILFIPWNKKIERIKTKYAI